MKHSIRQLVLRMAMLGIACFSATSALGQTAYPDKAIRMIVPLAAGSAVDKAARVVTQHMSQTLGQSIVIENQPGASGIIGAERVAKAEPDGYTIGGFNDSILTMVPHLHKEMPWDPIKDFTSVSLVGTVEWGLIVPAASKIRTAADLIKEAKAKPGSLMYSSGGNGSPQHIAMALFASKAGIKMMHVPYKGATPAAVAVAAGEVQAGFQGIATAIGLIQSEKLRLLAVTTPERLPQFPDTPTVNESGLPGFAFNSWFLIVAPAGTSPEIAEKLSRAARQALEDKEVVSQLSVIGMTPRGTTPDELAQATKDNLELYRRLLLDNGIQPE
ncbi:Bug family tripartite tricarboxylate transporter substrate binding protein [Paracandidimonas soli]|uniref:Tripartite-type tricarboxylate transporter receptor subunit TctC n=1 Tax=Paracandidimonas soli TaxID=1917182 RepID=A0A4V2VQM6_9BURK|nr:tripartite tricarboxylate transporter substrate binding protein [Paracandidimonas soli]TCU95239.1 tripartite-type tricarboxylate transporter receptor subunit TctC [Paracandidimonas soli]